MRKLMKFSATAQAAIALQLEDVTDSHAAVLMVLSSFAQLAVQFTALDAFQTELPLRSIERSQHTS